MVRFCEIILLKNRFLTTFRLFFVDLFLLLNIMYGYNDLLNRGHDSDGHYRVNNTYYTYNTFVVSGIDLRASCTVYDYDL